MTASPTLPPLLPHLVSEKLPHPPLVCPLSVGGGGRRGVGRGSPGDLAERRGQAGQMEGTGAAITTEQLPTVPAGRTLVLILLTKRHVCLEDPGWGGPPRDPHPHPSPLAHSQLKSCPDCLLPGAPRDPTISGTLAPSTLSWEERTV